VADLFTKWQLRVEEALSDYAHKVTYGNLRCTWSQWQTGGHPVTNLAVVYELPGGSTNQINQSFRHDDGSICYLDGDGVECLTRDLTIPLRLLEQAIAEIPARREQSLQETIRRWFGEGKTKQEIFKEINQLLQTDFKGGSLTHTELKTGINYVLQLAREAEAASS